MLSMSIWMQLIQNWLSMLSKMAKKAKRNIQTINLSTTTDFYSNTIPPATGATVSVINLSSDIAIIYNFIETTQALMYVLILIQLSTTNTN